MGEVRWVEGEYEDVVASRMDGRVERDSEEGRGRRRTLEYVSLLIRATECCENQKFGRRLVESERVAN